MRESKREREKESVREGKGRGQKGGGTRETAPVGV